MGQMLGVASLGNTAQRQMLRVASLEHTAQRQEQESLGLKKVDGEK